MLEKLKNIRWEYLILGAIASVFGLCFLFFQSSATTLTVIIGIFLALFGVGTACLCILGKSRGFGFVAKIVAAVLLFTSGVLGMAFNDAAVNIFVSAFCLLLIVDGAFKLQISIKSKILSVDGWWIITAISAAVIISAFLLAKIAPESTQGAAIWLGITMLADAVGNFLSIFWSAKCKTAGKAAIYYEVYKDIENTK